MSQHSIIKAQVSALQNVQKRAEQSHEQAVARINKVLNKAGVSIDLVVLVSKVQHLSRVTINFHPDRLANDGRSVAGGFVG